MTLIDLEPAAQRMADLIRGVPGRRLDASTPCAAYTLGDLLDHIGRLVLGFTAAATKTIDEASPESSTGDAARLGDEELVLHGWDVAAATGQAYQCDDLTLEVVRSFVSQFAAPDQDEQRGDAYRAPVPVSESASVLDRVVALSGRDPAWSPD
jgi:hypothetical protein